MSAVSRRWFLRRATPAKTPAVVAIPPVTSRNGTPTIVPFTDVRGVGHKSTGAPTMQSTTVEQSAEQSSEQTPPLPDLNQAILDQSGLESLFRDFAACTKVLDVTVKTAANRMTPQRRVTLDDAKALLLSNLVRGVQVRYLYDHAEWWDTLMCTPAGVRVVRIRHG